MTAPTFQSEFLVMGTGVAGLTFALRAAQAGTVHLVTKKEDYESNTNYAQGGIAAVFDHSDSYEAHIQDTIEAGAGLCHPNTVRIIVEQGPEVIQELIQMGANFTQGDDGSLDLGREGGHSFRRIVHAKDLTGREVEKSLLKQIHAHPNITVFEHHVGADLVVDQNIRRCWGAWIWDVNQHRLCLFTAGVTVLCTGGCGRVYQHSTNPNTATGDGMALALRHGARLANMEFMQFHPTAFYNPTEVRPFLISEAVRGEGAVLRTADGKAFMEKYHSKKDLAPRDIVARAIDNEMKTQGESCCYLDITNKSSAFLDERFPSITSYCRSQNIHPENDWIPVVPAAHYTCGGVMTNEFGETDIPGLFAAGEVAFTGVHGANRLASNSILEALVFSKRAVQHAIHSKLFAEKPPSTASCPWKLESVLRLEAIRLVSANQSLKKIMWDYVGIVRSNERLQLALQHVKLIREEMDSLIERGFLSTTLLENRSLSLISEIIIQSALSRHESRGLHFNIDHKEEWQNSVDTIISLQKNKNIKIQHTPIPG